MKCKECVYRLDVPHFFSKEDERVEDYYKYNHDGFVFLMCVNCGDEQHVNLEREVVERMMYSDVLLNGDMLE